MDSIFLGNHSTEKLKTLIENKKITRIYLVTNRNSFVSSGVSDHIFQHLVNCEYRRYKDFSVNPKFEEIEYGVKEVNEFKLPVLVSIDVNLPLALEVNEFKLPVEVSNKPNLVF